MSRYSGYNDSLNPTIYNEFSAAAFRLGHSKVSDDILLIGAGGQELLQSPLELRDAFISSPSIFAEEGGIESVIRGLASKEHQALDVKVIHTLRNMLFGAPGSGGLDLISLNIQRGRDYGLPSYNDMREVMGFPRLKSLQNAYGDVDNIDL